MNLETSPHDPLNGLEVKQLLLRRIETLLDHQEALVISNTFKRIEGRIYLELNLSPHPEEIHPFDLEAEVVAGDASEEIAATVKDKLAVTNPHPETVRQELAGQDGEAESAATETNRGNVTAAVKDYLSAYQKKRKTGK